MGVQKRCERGIETKLGEVEVSQLDECFTQHNLGLVELFWRRGGTMSKVLFSIYPSVDITSTARRVAATSVLACSVLSTSNKIGGM